MHIIEKFHRYCGYIGLSVFGVGIALLLLTFYLLWYTYDNAPEMLQNINLENLGQNLGLLLSYGVKFIFLFLMAICASLLAGKGIELYNASKLPPQAVAGEQQPKEKEEPQKSRGFF